MELRDELLNSLLLDNTHIKLEDLDSENKLEKIMPIVREMKLVGECRYHVVDVYKHSIYALKELEEDIRDIDFFSSHISENIKLYLEENIDNKFNRYNILKLGLFLHDAGKPGSKTIDSTGRAHFKGHEIVGEEIGNEIADELRLSNKAKELLCRYIRHHMILLVLYKTDNMNRDNLFKIFDELEDDIIGIMLLGYADIVATRKLLNPNEDMGIIKIYMEYVLTNYIYKYKESKRI